jgi:PPOX class probable F420-dependent enzyme
VTEATDRFAAAQVARLATVTPDGPPHVVPIVFAMAESTLYTAVDGKPKSTHRLRRLANIEANPRVSLVVDHYDDDWSQLWWVRADGIAAIHHNDSICERGYELLRAKYPQYQYVPLDGPMIAVDIDQWSSWGISAR